MKARMWQADSGMFLGEIRKEATHDKNNQKN